MSYIDQSLKMQKRRHPVKQVTAEEAIAELNRVVDLSNDQIARIRAYADHWELIAQNLYKENETLRQLVVGLETKRNELQAENERLRKKVTKRQGKHKGEEWGE